MPASFASIVKVSEYILSSPFLSKIFVPASKGFVNLSGYRNLGLKLDERESYDRVYRLLQASQLSLSAKILPKDQAMTAQEDKPYLFPYLLEAEKAAFERATLDNISVVKHK
ncbi:hypothetical protein D0Z03_001034 [Geotrichum reessii]|nr:hypothetical protein D0Z03_001034 [Galactomyces reessii]